MYVASNLQFQHIMSAYMPDNCIGIQRKQYTTKQRIYIIGSKGELSAQGCIDICLTA